MISKDEQLSSLIELDKAFQQVIDRYEFSKDEMEMPLEQALENKSIDADFFLGVLQIYRDNDYFPETQLKSFPIPVIIDYLLRTHRDYLDKYLLEIDQILEYLESKSDQDVLFYLRNGLKLIIKELKAHIAMEEKHLFPYILGMKLAVDEGMPSEELEKRHEKFSLQKFKDYHGDEVEDQIASIREYLIKYFQNAQDLLSYRMLMQKLENFEQDLRVHALVEDEVLLPLAEGLEQRLGYQ